MELENKIKEIQFSEKSVEFGIDWLKENPNHALEAPGLSDLARYLLVEIQTLKGQLKDKKEYIFRVKGEDLISAFNTNANPEDRV